MTTRKTKGTHLYPVVAVLMALAASSGAFADGYGHSGFGGHEASAMERGHGAYGEYRDSAHEHFDSRFSHNHFYFDRGYTMHDVPRSGYAIDHDHHRYWYDRGEWYLW